MSTPDAKVPSTTTDLFLKSRDKEKGYRIRKAETRLEDTIDMWCICNMKQTVIDLFYLSERFRELADKYPKNDFFRQEWEDVQAWRTRLLERSCKSSFYKIRFLTIEDVSWLFNKHESLKFQTDQIKDSFYGKRGEDGDGGGLSLDYDEYNWEALLSPGGTVPVVGASGAGKSLFLAGVGWYLAHRGCTVITNISYYIDREDECENLFFVETFAEVVKIIGDVRSVDPQAHVVLIFDEFETLVNAWKQTTRLVGDLFVFINQMRKLGVTMIVLLKNERELNTRVRAGTATGGAVPTRIFVGAYGYDEYSDEVLYYSKKDDMWGNALVLKPLGKLPDGRDLFKERAITRIPDFSYLYETDGFSDMEMNVNIPLMIKDLKTVKRAPSRERRWEFHHNVAKMICENYESWLITSDTPGQDSQLRDMIKQKRIDIAQRVYDMNVKERVHYQDIAPILNNEREDDPIMALAFKQEFNQGNLQMLITRTKHKLVVVA